MNVNKPVSRPSLISNLKQLDAHVIAANEFEDLPELSNDMLSRAKLKKGGHPLSASPRKSISSRLTLEFIERWRATGPGWQTRMAERLNKV